MVYGLFDDCNLVHLVCFFFFLYLIHLNFSNYKIFSLHFMDICFGYLLLIYCYNYLIILLCLYFITIIFFIIDILMENPSHHSNSSSSSSSSEDEDTKLEITRVFKKNWLCCCSNY